MRALPLARLILAGAGLFLLLGAGEAFPVPGEIEAVLKPLHRAAFWACLPALAVLRPLFDAGGRAGSLLGLGAAALASPVLYWLAWRSWAGRRRRAGGAPGRAVAAGSDRRGFLRRAAAAGGGALLAGTGAYAVFIEPELLRVRRYTLPIRDLPITLEGLCLVQVSDTHLGPFVPLWFLQEAVRQANALAPDLIVLTGDYVHRTPLAIGPGIGLLGALRARLGIAAVLGNHDHWLGAAACRRAFAGIGVPLLDNDRLFLTPLGLQAEAPMAGEGICLAGVGDLWADELCPDRALGGVPEEMPRLLLSHHPDAVEMMGTGRRLDLVLAGHTHGGQVALPRFGPPIVPSAFGTRYAGGLCRGPVCPVVVSRGVGMAILPLRLGVPPELVAVTLQRAII